MPPWLLNDVPSSDRYWVFHPSFWHSFALLEFPPPAIAVATPTVSANMAHNNNTIRVLVIRPLDSPLRCAGPQ